MVQHPRTETPERLAFVIDGIPGVTDIANSRIYPDAAAKLPVARIFIDHDDPQVQGHMRPGIRRVERTMVVMITLAFAAPADGNRAFEGGMNDAIAHIERCLAANPHLKIADGKPYARSLKQGPIRSGFDRNNPRLIVVAIPVVVVVDYREGADDHPFTQP